MQVVPGGASAGSFRAKVLISQGKEFAYRMSSSLVAADPGPVRDIASLCFCMLV